MMPLTLAAVGHVASLDIYSGHLVMIDSINHVSSRTIPNNLPFYEDHWTDTWNRTYLINYSCSEDVVYGYGGYIQPARGTTHTFRVKNVTSLPSIACYSSNLREFSIINNTGSISTFDPTMYVDGNPPNAFGLVDLDISLNFIRTLVVRNAPCLRTLNSIGNQLTTFQVNTILSNLVADGGRAGGSVNLDGQTPAAPPTTGPPDGVAAKAALLVETPPWTVTTD